MRKTTSSSNDHRTADASKKTARQKYLRFGAIIVTSMVFMYIVMYVNTYQWSHVNWSETRLFKTLLMGATMAVVMLLFMLDMYKNTKVNIGIVALSLGVFALGAFLVRSQTTVDDESYMRAMIPHHSIAILTSQNSEIQDVRVCRLAKDIIEAQKREIDEMQWLVDDINKNGPVKNAEEARQRQVPEFSGEALRSCE